MAQIMLFAPDITCDHCIATIQKVVDATDGFAFVEGDVDSRSFAVDMRSGGSLDALGAALADEGYPLGDARAARASAPNVSMNLGTSAFAPEYTVEKSPEGASITYTCPCGSTTEHYDYDRAQPEQEVGSCCDHHLLVEAGASKRLREILGPGYGIDVQTVQMPWGQPLEAAFASRG